MENFIFSAVMLDIKRTDRIRNDRSNYWRWFIKKGGLKSFAKFTEKHLCQSLF